MINLNLLPPAERRAAFRKITLRALSAAVFFGVLWCGVLLAVVAQGWVFLHIQNDALAGRLHVEQATDTAQQTKGFEAAAKKTNALLSYSVKVGGESKDDDAYLVWLASSLVPSGVHIHSMSINSVSGTLTIGGIADTRDEFLAFRELLQNQGDYFAGIQSPLSNILSPDNASFSLLITLKR